MRTTEGVVTAMGRGVVTINRGVAAKETRADILKAVSCFTNSFFMIVFYNLRGSVMYTYYR